ncbi:hypothetical protein F3Y22_tig00005411pilonHSYRG00051 [Hibiscus syriacus]|uniref:Uncharacterized protein n=1 Tax=Hibiscus syriacus TaxID=106335 RepID=A0A6A3CG14_HIBSY|nr:uncharacterized protein LOC120199364 [Hibiscus syriacus]KAE8727637.1 hypothetical protein F3Y22_tig00005411pilonHSYRG00051 [Hibiscus syriacus]
MKLVWSPETASKAYIDTVKSCELHHESGVAELVSAMAAGWNARFIMETWSLGGATATSVGLAVATSHTDGRHVCMVPDERSRLAYVEALEEAGMSSPEVIVGEPEEVMDRLNGIDFMVVDSHRKDFSWVLRLAKLSNRGAVLVCKNANSKSASSFKWRSVTDDGSRRLVRSVFLPVGKGLDIAHVATTSGGNSSSGKGKRRWIKHVDRQSGEEYVIRK